MAITVTKHFLQFFFVKIFRTTENFFDANFGPEKQSTRKFWLYCLRVLSLVPLS